MTKKLQPMSGNHRHSDRRRPDRRGATLVEFALTIPIFILFLFAALEFGWLNVIRHTADNAAYEAARAAIVPGATAAEATAKANDLLNVVGTRGATVTITPPTLSTSTDEVTVAIDVPMRLNGIILSRFTSRNVLHSQATLRTERPE